MTSFLLALTFAATPPPVTAVAYSPDGMRLVAGTRSAATIFDSITGHSIVNLTGPSGRVTALAVSRNDLIATASGEPGKAGHVHFFDLRTGKAQSTSPGIAAAHTDTIYALAFTPDGKTLATAGYDRVVKLWDVPPQASPRFTLTDHSDTVYAADFDPTGRLLATASADRTVKVWDVATGKRLYTLSDATDWIYTVAWSPDGKHLAAAGADKAVRIWAADAAGGTLVKSAFAHEKAVSRLGFDGSGATIATAGEDRVVKLWDATKLTEIRTLPARADDILALAMGPNGKQIAVGRFDGVLEIIDAASGNVVATPLPVRAPQTPKPTPPKTDAKPQTPVVSSVAPDAGPRGATLKVQFQGQGLERVTGLKSSQPGITAKITADKSTRTQITFELTIAADSPPGVVDLSLTDPAGESKPVRFFVDRFSALVEAGTTDSARTAMAIKLPVTIVGTLDRPGDVDYFRFDATAGQEVGVQVQTRADRGKFEAVIVITDSGGRVLADGTDRLGFVVPTTGSYILAIRDRDYRGGAELAYRLHIGPVPVVTQVFPLGVTRGVETMVHVSGVNLGQPGGLDVPIRPRIDAALGAKLPVTTVKNGDPVGSDEVTVGEFPATRDIALPAIPFTADNVLTPAGATRNIRFPAKKGQRLIVEVHAARLGSSVDSRLEIRFANGLPVPRAVLRSVAKTFVTFRDHDSEKPGIRLETWNDVTTDDLLFVDGDLMKIQSLPRGPDDDCLFYAVANKRVGFLGTTPTHHAMNVPMYKVEVHPPGVTFPPNGLPVFPMYYRNDDGGPGFGTDSRLFFDPPADGIYEAVVADANGAGGPRHAFRLTVRPPQPDYTLKVTPENPKVWANGAVPITVTANRLDGFDGPIAIEFEGLPKGLTGRGSRIGAGQESTVLALAAEAAPGTTPLSAITIRGRANSDGRLLLRDAIIPNPTIVPAGELTTTVNVTELTLRPGTEARFQVTIQRQNGFTGRVPLDVRGLPHGVKVLNVGLNGILITPDRTTREVVLFAESWVQPLNQPIVVLSRVEKSGAEHAAAGIMLKVLDK